MSYISIQVKQDQAHKFHCLFDSLSDLRKRIWLKIVWYVKKFPVAKLSQSTIAKACHCCRQAVSEAFRLFRQYEWLLLISRGWKKSKVLIIPEYLQAESLYQSTGSKTVDFVYERATYVATPINTSYKNKNTSRTGEPTRAPKIQEYLKNLDIPFEAKLKLSTLSEDIYIKTLEVCQRKAKKGFKPDNQVAYFVGTAFKIAEKQNFKPNWRLYYA